MEMNDPIEEFLQKVEREIKAAHPKLKMFHLLALVRIYREANEFYKNTENYNQTFTTSPKYSEEWKILEDSGEKARMAESKALEFVSG